MKFNRPWALAGWVRYIALGTRASIARLVKILPTHLCENPEFKQRFEREARTVSSLNHASIV
jgi:hypothetical protein